MICASRIWEASGSPFNAMILCPNGKDEPFTTALFTSPNRRGCPLPVIRRKFDISYELSAPSELAAYKSVTVYSSYQLEEHDMGPCALETRLMALEREHKKIDAFKRELPLCMQLLHDAIEACKEQLAFYRSSSQKQWQDLVSCSFDNRGSVVQTETKEQEPNTVRKHTNSLYTDSNDVDQGRVVQCLGDTLNRIKAWNTRAGSSSGDREKDWWTSSSEDGFPWSMQGQAFGWPLRSFVGSNRKLGGAFLPYNRLIQPIPRPGAIDPAALSLKCPDSETTEPSNQLGSSGIDGTFCGNGQRHNGSSAGLPASFCTRRETNFQHQVEQVPKEQANINLSGIHSTRKARRSWSPELHRLFVNALEKLGGAQATPKQIRELMNVEGLTNDEVKSHLQKYRLHARRLGISPTRSSQSPAVVSAESTLHGRGAGAPISYNDASLRQSQSCEASATLDAAYCTSQALSQISSSCVRQTTVPHSQHSWQGTADVGREESVGEAARPENSGSKSRQMHETDEMEDHSFSGNQTHSHGDDEMCYDDDENGSTRLGRTA